MGFPRMNRSFLLEMEGQGDWCVRVTSRGKVMGLKDICNPGPKMDWFSW